jgi:hypothetical protein
MIVTENSDVDSLECDVATMEKLINLQEKLIRLMKAGACSHFSLDCVVDGKIQKIVVKSSDSLGFFEKIFNKVV